MKDIDTDTLREYVAAFRLKLECAQESATAYRKDLTRVEAAFASLIKKLGEFVEDET